MKFISLCGLFCRELKLKSFDWFYNNVSQKFKRFGSAKVVRSLYKQRGARGRAYHSKFISNERETTLIQSSHLYSPSSGNIIGFIEGWLSTCSWIYCLDIQKYFVCVSTLHVRISLFAWKKNLFAGMYSFFPSIIIFIIYLSNGADGSFKFFRIKISLLSGVFVAIVVNISYFHLLKNHWPNFN